MHNSHNDINLYDYAPDEGDNIVSELVFNDMNHTTGTGTKITAENAGVWKVKKDTVTKEFEVTYLPAGNAKSMATFAILPAGLFGSDVKTVVIGGEGTSATIVAQDSAATIRFGKSSNISSAVKFKDANGRVMDRIKDADRYPLFLGGIDAENIMTNAKIDNDDIDEWYWVVSTDKLDTDSTNGGAAGDTDKALNVSATVGYDADSKIEADTPTAYNTTTKVGTFGVTNTAPTANFYITLLGTANHNTNTYKVLDSQAYRFIYVPASTTKVTYKVKDTSKALLYAAPGSEDNESITLIATNQAGETWEEDAGSLTPSAPFTSKGNSISGNIPAKIGKGSLDVTVYAADGTKVDTVKIAYDDADPVPTSTSKGLATTDAVAGSVTPNTTGVAPEGTNWSPSAILDLKASSNAASTVTMEDGLFTITNATVWGDTFTAEIKDQYGVRMKNSLAKVDGYELGDATNGANELLATQYNTTGVPASGIAFDAEKGNFIISNGSQRIDLTLTAGDTEGMNVTINPAVYSTSTTVETDTELLAALAAGTTTITLAKNIEVDDAITIPNGTELVIPTGKKLTTDGAVTVGSGAKKDTTKKQDTDAVVTVAGIWEHNGVDATDGKQTITNNGSIIVTGTANFTDTDITNNGYFNEGTASLHFFGTSSIAGTGTFSGKMAVEPECVLTFNSTPTIIGTLDVDGVVDFNSKAVNFANASDETATTVDISNGAVLGADYVKLAEGVKVTAKDSEGVIQTATTPADVEDGGALAPVAADADTDTGLITEFVKAWNKLPANTTIADEATCADVATKLELIDDVLTLAEDVEDTTDTSKKLAYQVGIVKALGDEKLTDWTDIYSEDEPVGYLQTLVSGWKDAVEDYGTSLIEALNEAVGAYIANPSDSSASDLETAYAALKTTSTSDDASDGTSDGTSDDAVHSYTELLETYAWLGAKGLDELDTGDVVDHAEDLLGLANITALNTASGDTNAEKKVEFTGTNGFTDPTVGVASAGDGKIAASYASNTLTVTASGAAQDVGVSVSFEGTYYTKTFKFTATATNDNSPELTSLAAGTVTVTALNNG